MAARVLSRGVTLKGVNFSEEQLQALADNGLLDFAQKNDPASTTPTNAVLHGYGQTGAIAGGTQAGVFTYPGVRPQMFSTFVRPRSAARLFGLKKSEFADEILETMTGLTAGVGTNASSWCGDPPSVGALKTCQQIYKFGSWYMKTALNAVPEIGHLRNRADMVREIINQGPQANPWVPDVMYRLADTRSQLQHELFKVGAEFERQIEKVLWTGSFAQSSAATDLGWMKEFNGFDLQVKTGYADAVTNLACQAMDSIITNFNTNIDSTIGGGDGRNIVQAISDTYYAIMDVAASVGLDNGLEVAIFMRKEQFRALTEVWVCQYNTYRCSSSNAGQPILNDAVAQNQMRLEMWNGQYLLIDGVQVPVVFTDGIPLENTANATYKADIFFLPISWNGMPLVNIEYFPMDNSYAREYAAFADADDIQTLNNGLFIVGTRSTGLCKEYLFGSKIRMILETPFLAARVDDVIFTYRAQTRDAQVGSSFYKNGGISYRSI